ncbi:MAG: adenylate kinase, partial [Armatimonadota bacterium]|nr:adenylate kinase [Armatimonadota bacterium]
LLGPPGSGKGTQAKKLAVMLGMPHISTGDLFRAEIAAESELGKLANEYITHGNLVPDEVVNAMMRERLAQEDCAGYVLDGYPRTVQQAEALEQVLSEIKRPLCVAIELDVPDDIIVQRAIGRLVCSQCGAIYHLTSKPPRRMGVCDICYGVLVVRDDDQPSTVRQRLQIYHRITEPVLRFYADRGVLRSISGLGTVEEIAERLRAQLQDV